MSRNPQPWLVICALLALTSAMAPGCDCRAPRGKPWRHEADPKSLANAEPRSPALARDEATSAVLAERDHTLRVHMDAEPRALNPLVAPSVWARRVTMGTVFETLIRYEPPEGGAGAGPGRYAPGLARSWRVMPDGREIRFYLEPGVKFHDGRPMTSVDVQFTLDAIRSPSTGIDHLRPMLKDVFAVELITSREVRIVLNRPNGWVLRALAEIPILPMHVYDGSFQAGGRIVGTGPWQLASWKDGVVHLARFGGYWGAKPAIPDIEFAYEPDAARALMEAKRGAFDIIPALIPAHWPEQATAPGLASAFTALELRPPRLRYVAFRCAPPLDDPRVRQAISLLIDRQKYAKEAMDGLARPIGGPVWPGGPGDGPAPPAPEQDPARAGKLLDEAGWIDSDKDGVRDRGGVRLHIVALISEEDDPAPVGPKAPPVRSALIEPLKRAGISVDVRPGTEAVLAKLVRAGDFGIAFLEAALPVDMDLTPLLGTGGDLDVGRCGTPRIDAALEALEGAYEPAARVPLIAELSAALAESWPIAGIVAPAPQGLIHRRVQGAVVWDGWIDLRRLSLAPDSPAQ
jgi:peptide/nickel transport system substrate-binding protein